MKVCKVFSSSSSTLKNQKNQKNKEKDSPLSIAFLSIQENIIILFQTQVSSLTCDMLELIQELDFYSSSSQNRLEKPYALSLSEKVYQYLLQEKNLQPIYYKQKFQKNEFQYPNVNYLLLIN
jgi:hypothetical protein